MLYSIYFSLLTSSISTPADHHCHTGPHGRTVKTDENAYDKSLALKIHSSCSNHCIPSSAASSNVTVNTCMYKWKMIVNHVFSLANTYQVQTVMYKWLGTNASSKNHTILQCKKISHLSTQRRHTAHRVEICYQRLNANKSVCWKTSDGMQ